jgi:hypothetical protein
MFPSLTGSHHRAPQDFSSMSSANKSMLIFQYQVMPDEKNSCHIASSKATYPR